MNASNRQTVVGIGELLWDCFADRRLPGGAPANVAFHAAQLGHRAAVVSRVGDDDLGRELLCYLGARGVDVGWVQIDPERPTGRVLVDTATPTYPVYTILEDAAWDALEFEARLGELIASASAVAVGTLAQRSDRSRETIAACLERTTTALVVFDVNLRQSYYRRAWIERTLDLSSLVKLSEDEVAVLSDLLGVPHSSPAAFCRELIGRHAVELVCITRAADGCLLVDEREQHDQPGMPVEVRDAVGAGDAFTAALISARLRGWPLAATARFANEVGGLVASRSGAMPDIRSELAAIVQQAGKPTIED